MSNEKKPRDVWIREDYCEVLDHEPNSFNSVHNEHFHCREVLPDPEDDRAPTEEQRRNMIFGEWPQEDPRAAGEFTEREQRKLIERTCKRDAYMDMLQWAGIALDQSVEPNNALWFAMEKYKNHQKFCDEHTHYYDYKGEVLPKEALRAGILAKGEEG